MLDSQQNIDKSLLIQILQFFMEKECHNWFITDYKLNHNSFITLYTSELVHDNDRQIDYHWQRQQTTDINQNEDFTRWVRDYRISQINDDSFDIFSYEERLKIELLRIQSHFDSNKKKVITRNQAIDEANKNFKLGDRIWFNRMPGFITYKHKGEELKFTINVKDTYYKYVPASSLTPRMKKDLSHIEVPKKYQEMTTKELLGIAKRIRKSHYGRIGDVIKAELNKREHVKKKTKTKIYGK